MKAYIKKNNIQTVFLTGVKSQRCIASSLIEAYNDKELGVHVVVLEACIASDDVEQHEMMLKEMEIFEKALKVNSLTTNQVVQIGERPREVVLEEHLLSLLLQSLNPGKYEQELSLLKNYYQNELLKKILVNLTNFLTQQKNWDIKKFAKISPIEFVSTIDRLFLQDLKIETEEEKDNDFRRTTREIKINGLKNKLQKIGKEIEKATEEKMIKKLTLEFEKTTTEMKEWSR